MSLPRPKMGLLLVFIFVAVPVVAMPMFFLLVRIGGVAPFFVEDVAENHPARRSVLHRKDLSVDDISLVTSVAVLCATAVLCFALTALRFARMNLEELC